jgi:hypothetical protein
VNSGDWINLLSIVHVAGEQWRASPLFLGRTALAQTKMVGSGRVWPSPKKKEEENISWVELAYLLSNLFWTDFSPAMMGSSQYIWANPSLYIYNILLLYCIQQIPKKIPKILLEICDFFMYFYTILINISLYFYIVKIQI